jgi:hypothetical protein
MMGIVKRSPPWARQPPASASPRAVDRRQLRVVSQLALLEGTVTACIYKTRT